MAASDQIRQMVNFILQEAHEKANEIRVKVCAVPVVHRQCRVLTVVSTKSTYTLRAGARLEAIFFFFCFYRQQQRIYPVLLACLLAFPCLSFVKNRMPLTCQILT